MSAWKERRIKKELSRLEDQGFEFSYSENIFEITLYDEKILQIHLDSNYPFHCPEIMIDGFLYKYKLRLTTSQKKLFRQLNPDQCCLVCTSFVCKDNWNVCKSIKDVILDVESHLKKKEAITTQELWSETQVRFCLPAFPLISFFL